MPNPTKPAELKALQGNPGRRELPKTVVQIQHGYRDPLRPLDWAGLQLWKEVLTAGEMWVANTDLQLLQMVCEQLDRKTNLESYIAEHPDEWHMYKQLNDLERLITANLSLLGFTPSDRTKLGLVSVKAKSKLEELLERKRNNVVATANPDSDSE